MVAARGAIDKLDVYRGLEVREVWVFEHGEFQLFALRGDRYESLARSEVLPELDPLRLAHLVARPDQHAALKAYRDELRA